QLAAPTRIFGRELISQRNVSLHAFIYKSAKESGRASHPRSGLIGEETCQKSGGRLFCKFGRLRAGSYGRQVQWCECARGRAWSRRVEADPLVTPGGVCAPPQRSRLEEFFGLPIPGRAGASRNEPI